RHRSENRVRRSRETTGRIHRTITRETKTRTKSREGFAKTELIAMASPAQCRTGFFVLLDGGAPQGFGEPLLARPDEGVRVYADRGYFRERAGFTWTNVSAGFG